MEANEISILIATDNHLGYMERDPVRGKDSMTTFEEILKIARDRNVDFILLGGDLYHDNKPSRRTTYESMALFREYCWGDRPCQLEILSDESVNFQDRFSTVNYNDLNINVSIPVFSIHGNHDDPTGDGRYCALDLLSVSGFVNYYGKCSDVDNITLSPVLLKKNETKLALYGLGNVRDERLNRTFRRRNVKILRPDEDTGDWFNLLVLHQNRIPHGPKNYIPENFLDDFLHFVLWGHEHECLIDPQQNPQQKFYVTQPGSSIATSLSEGESKQKHVGILRIRGTSHKMEKIMLKTVRPFVMRETILATELGVDKREDKYVAAHLRKIVQSMVNEALEDYIKLNPDIPESKVPRPLIRLKVEYTGGFSTYNPQQFGREFVSIVANPKDMLLFYRRKAAPAVPFSSKSNVPADPASVNLSSSSAPLDAISMDELVQEYLQAQSLSILPENQLMQAVGIFVDKDDKEAIKEFVNSSIEITRGMLGSFNLEDEEDIQKHVEDAKQKLAKDFSASGKALVIQTKKSTSHAKKAAETKKKASAKPKGRGKKAAVVESESDQESEEDIIPKRKGKQVATLSDDDEVELSTTRKSSASKSIGDEDDEVVFIAPPPKKKIMGNNSRANSESSDINASIAEPDEPVFAKPAGRRLPFGNASASSSRKRNVPDVDQKPKKKPVAKKGTTSGGIGMKQSQINFQKKSKLLDEDADETFEEFSERG